MLSLRFNHLVELRGKLFNKEDYLKEYLGIPPPASVETCVTKEDCDTLLERLNIKLNNKEESTMSAKHIEDINEYVLNQIKAGASVLACKKTALVKARQVVLGEVIKTDIDKTENTVKEDPKTGNPIWVVTNPGGEEYLVEDSVFTNIYEEVQGNEGCYRKKAIQLLTPCIETVEFVPAWGGTFTIEKGGYLTINSYKDIAGVHSDIFYATYEVVSSSEKEVAEALRILSGEQVKSSSTDDLKTISLFDK